ncbi:type I polyketide synthase [Streptomyces sp. NPDC020965]|uniref:type I polyketide synthase n=1 Tax=Streptomyces sp. NPDC020965 TaxID=3365105 RepID=UPI0037A49233
MNDRTTRGDIAVVGLACRVPGAGTPGELWRLLLDGRRAAGRAPGDRFDRGAIPAGSWRQAVHGSYADDVARFDAALFGVSEREATTMDPHQRWALELGWAALEDAGEVPGAPRDTEFGVFVGSMGADWAMEHAAGRLAPIGPSSLTGWSPSVMANRISHVFGLRGPSVVVDTGQSSSLVAVHQAVLALRAGDCSAALVVGVNLNLSTEAATATAAFGGQSPSGSATLFEDGADGYVRGEGGAAVVLRPLADAVRAGDRVHAVIRGTAVTHGGGTGAGPVRAVPAGPRRAPGPDLVVPTAEGQARALRRACAVAGLAPGDLGFVELHGTGTAVGDRAEAGALLRVFGGCVDGIGAGDDGAGEAPALGDGASGDRAFGDGGAAAGTGAGGAGGGLVLGGPAGGGRADGIGAGGDGTGGGLVLGDGASGDRVFGVGAATGAGGAGGGPADGGCADGIGAGGGGAGGGLVLGDGASGDRAFGVGGAAGGAGGTARLLVGSIKTSTGHLEGAAGLLGLVKAVLVARHGVVPGTAGHLGGALADRLAAAGIDVPARAVPLRDGAAVGVSAVGMGGTNCHVVLSPYQPDAVTEPIDGQDASAGGAPLPVPVLLSAESEESLRLTAAALAEWAGTQDTAQASGPPAAVARTLATRRARLSVRRGFTARDTDELRARLRTIADGGRDRAVPLGSGPRGRTVFLFPGQGSQRPGTGAALHRHLPSFARHFDAVAAVADPLMELPLHRVAFDPPPTGDGADAPIHATQYTQIALFALGVALYGGVSDLGVVPDVLLGHSVGELAAAHVSGVLSLPDAVRLVLARGAAMAQADPDGVMVAVEASEDEVRTVVAGHPGTTVAAVNGPAGTVLSGDRRATLACARVLRDRGHRTKVLKVAHAFHSHHMDPVLAEFRAVAETVDHGRPTVPVLSNVTGALATGDELRTADYWVDHVRHTVRFGDCLERLAESGTSLFLELGPGGALTAMARAAVRTPDGAAPAAGSLLGDGSDEYGAFLETLVLAHVQGQDIDWARLPGLDRGPWAPLPTHRFTGRRYWPGTETAAAPTPAPAAPARPGGDPLGLVLATVAEVLGVRPAHAVGATDTLADLGMTSLLGLELRAELAARTGRELPTSLVYDHPTPAALAAFLTGPDETPVPASAERAERPGTPPTAPDDDPVVIAAMACRYPGGVSSPGQLWELALSGGDALGGFPEDRGPAWAVPGPYPRYGGFLADVAGFDAAHFGISPREARAMDPQQRIALELCWEALERAGCDPRSLRGQEVGVFLGAMAGDYATAARDAGDDLGGHELTGASNAVLSGRVSYQLGLTGPALTVDTACSSSLVAVHLAAAALRRGECELALAGGVTVMSTPKMFQEFQRLGGLSADGRCRPFSAAADGTVWSEGAGVVVVARRSEARRRGLRILATLRGSAVNQDGASNGLTAPSGTAQRRVITRALADAGLTAGDVDVVEAHGTGTVLGDSVEAGAVIDTYGVRDRAAAPLLIGSLKSVIGHTQAAAGVGGLIAMVMSLREQRLPATRYADEPTPKVEWPESVRLLERSAAWPRGGRVRRAGISSFGMSGTNAHLVIEEPAPPIGEGALPRPEEAPPALPFVVSAGDRATLRTQLERVRTALAGDPDRPGPPLAATALTLATRRAALPYRASVVAGDRAGLLAGLDAARRGEAAAGVASGEARGDCAVAFVFPGQGSQWSGMGRLLLRESPVFADTVAACADAFAPYTDLSIPDLVTGADDGGRPPGLEAVQVSLFVTMVGLVELWRSRGVVPDLVLGHSQGEVAAAYAAGALDLGDAARTVATRARLLSRLSGSGAMAVIGLDESAARAALADSPDGADGAGGVAVAAVNGPGSTVVSGPVAAVRALVDRLSAAGVRTATVAVDYASHSAMVEPVEAELTAALADISPRTARTPFFSTTRAAWLTGTELDAAYWYENLRGEVRFARSVAAVAGSRRTAFIEISPHEVLTSPITATLDGLVDGADTIVLGSLRRDHGSYRDFLSSVSLAWTRGIPVGWTADTFGGPVAEPVDLPPTPFARRPFWIRPTTRVPVPPLTDADPPEPARGEQAPPAPAVRPDTAVLAAVAGVLHLAPAEAGERGHHTFTELGLDSLTTVDLRRRLREALGLTVPVQVFTTHDTPLALTRWVARALNTTPGDPPEASTPPDPTETNTPHHGAPGRHPEIRASTGANTAATTRATETEIDEEYGDE